MNLPPGERDKARLPSLRLLIGLCSDSLVSRLRARGEARARPRLSSAAASVSPLPRLSARGTASLPDKRRGRPRFRLGPRKLGEVALAAAWAEEEACSRLRAAVSGERRAGWNPGTRCEGGIARGSRGGGGPGHGRGLVLAHVGQALDLEPLSHLEEGGEVLLVHGDLAPVHELQESLHLVIADILQKDDWVLVGRVVKHGLKVRRTGGQHDFVGFQVEAIARNGHVHEGLVVEKILEDGKKIVLVVVPAETVLLGLGGGGGLHCHGGGGWGGAQQLT